MSVSSSQPETLLVQRYEVFRANGTWTVPAGVTYAIARMLGGGGAGGNNNAAGADGAASTVTFASGLVSGPGGRGGLVVSSNNTTARAHVANSGMGSRGWQGRALHGRDARSTVVGADVTPGASIPIVVGAGGTNTNNRGASGMVVIEYQEPLVNDLLPSRGNATRSRVLIRKADRFLGNGTWIVPEGVRFATAHILSGGGAGGNANVAGAAGGLSRVAFPTGNADVAGGIGGLAVSSNLGSNYVLTAFSGQGNWGWGDMTQGFGGNYVEFTSAVVPGNSIAITVGAGGTNTNMQGSSGQVTIVYEQEVVI